MGIARRILALILGTRIELPSHLLERFPELGDAQWRRGGLPLRVGGLLLGTSTVAGITLWRTIWLAPGVALSERLLLHELRHVQQFGEDVLFPLRYLYGSIRHGYRRNPYEADADAFAARRLAEAGDPFPPAAA